MRIACVLLALLAAASPAAADDPPESGPKPVAKPAAEKPAEKPPEEKTPGKRAPEKPAEGRKETPAAPKGWLTDAAAARREAKERGTRVLAVVLAGWYESEPSTRLEKAVEEETAKSATTGLVPLRVTEKEDLAFSKSAGLEDLGHPYTALLDAEGKAVAWKRGAMAAADWANEVRRLSDATTAFESKRAAAEKAPADARAIWEWSESLRPLGRVREADEVLARAERADPQDRAGLAPEFRFRRVEARVEDLLAAQDFAGARDLCDAYDREFPGSPRRSRVAFWRAVCRAYLGEPDAAKKDLEALAADAADEDLRALAKERADAVGRALEKRAGK